MCTTVFALLPERCAVFFVAVVECVLFTTAETFDAMAQTAHGTGSKAWRARLLTQMTMVDGGVEIPITTYLQYQFIRAVNVGGNIFHAEFLGISFQVELCLSNFELGAASSNEYL
jgi:hypothetical protein